MLKTLKIATSDLAIGMFVSRLDRPWLDTPFMTQGFFIEHQEDISRVQKYCEHVFVDSQRSVKPTVRVRREVMQSRADKAADKTVAGKPKERPRVPVEKIFEGRTIKPYPDSRAWEEEHPMAKEALDSLVIDIDHLFDEVSDGEKLNVIKMRKSVDPVVDSISRNPDALLWVSRLKQHDRYTYQHSLGAAIWAVSLGRQLGLPRHDLRSLGMGCMLMDVGKLRVDPNLLQANRELTNGEMADVAAHVSHGLDILDECGIMNQDVIDMVAHHHERHDGSGYPQGLAGDGIPAFARIAGIVDTYDAITSNRYYAPAVSPTEAIKLLYNARDEDFQAELVEAFIQAIGIYPAGTIVELSSGEVGVVVAEYRTRRLRPKVMVLLDANKKQLPRSRLVDLQEGAENGAAALTIKCSLEPTAYGIDLTRIAI